MRVAAWQPPFTNDVDEAVARLRAALRQADTGGVDLVCFPECYVGGYFPNDRAATERVAYEIGTPSCQALLERIGRFDATLVVGIAERRDTELFNTALVVARARQTGCWVLSSDIVGRTDERVAHGCAAVVDATGRVLARVPEDRQGVVTHDLA